MYNLFLESFEIDSIYVNMVYLCSCAKDFLQDSFFLHQYTASSISGRLKQSWKVLWNVAKLCCHGHMTDLNVSIVMAFQCLFQSQAWEKIRRWQIWIIWLCGNIVIWCIDKNSLMNNAVCGHASSCRRNHFPVFAVCPILLAIFVLWFWPAFARRDALHLSSYNIRNVSLLSMYCTLTFIRRLLNYSSCSRYVVFLTMAL